MKRPPSHVTDIAAQAIFQDLTKDLGVTDRLANDYGKDYRVELVEGDRVSGVAFMVQLKGTAGYRHSRDRSQVQFRMETRHLQYYFEKVREPVFLVVVDTEAREAVWLFLQGWVAKQKQIKWASRTMTVSIPAAQSLADHGLLRKAVAQSIEFMTSLRPGTVRDAITHQASRFSELDNRFRPRVTVVGGREIWTFDAVEEVALQFKLSGPTAQLAAAKGALFDEGREVSLADLKLEVTGSPLLSDVASKAVSVSFTKRIAATLKVVLDGSSVAIDPLSGFLVGGQRQLRFEQSPSRHPLRLHLGIDPTMDPPIERVIVKMDVLLSGWAGQSINSLSYFDQVAAFTKQATLGLPMDMFIEVDGNRAMGWRCHVNRDESIESANVVVRFLQAMRQISGWSHCELALPSAFPTGLCDADLRGAERLIELLDPDVAKGDCGDCIVEAEVDRGASFRVGQAIPGFRHVQDVGVPIMGMWVVVRHASTEVSQLVVEHVKAKSDPAGLESSDDAVVTLRAPEGATFRRGYQSVEIHKTRPPSS